MIKNLKAFIKNASPGLYKWHLKREKHQILQRVRLILEDASQSVNLNDDEFFILQDQYTQWWPQYDFDQYSTGLRSFERAISFLKNIEEIRTPGRNILELACGDGMAGTVLAAYGHKTTLLDYQDWRDPRAALTPFIQADLAHPIPIANDSYDFVFSFNAFEHIPDPSLALSEAVRILRPGGYVWLDFNPLYCSPLGLHAFSFRMPYPQFLFSADTIRRKLDDLGLHDLGCERQQLQPLNQWRPDQFRRIWKRIDCDIIRATETIDSQHLNVVLKYPQAFRGRDLTIDDLTVSGMHVLLRKKADCGAPQN